MPELLARVKGLLRRASPERLATVLTYGDIKLDREKHRAARSGRPIDLGPTEYRLLQFFLEHPGRVFSREQLVDSVWTATSTSTSTPWTFTSGGCAGCSILMASRSDPHGARRRLRPGRSL